MSNEGLPKLGIKPGNNGEGSKKEKGGAINKKVVLVGVLGLVLFGFGVQYLIDKVGMFEQEAVVLNEPPIPVMEGVEGVSLSSENDLNIGGEEGAKPEAVFLSSENVNGEVELSDELQNSVVKKELEKQLTKVRSEIAFVNEKLDKQNRLLRELLSNQLTITDKFSKKFVDLGVEDKKIIANLKNNERWLNGISEQLKGIGVSVNESVMEFPVIVYDKNIWGDDAYLTVAQKSNPDRSSSMRVGDVVGRWKLLSINDEQAVFEHFEGMRKEVSL